MMRNWIIIGCTILLIFCSGWLPAQTRLVPVESISRLQQTDHDTVYVINFWATWCKPCIKEIPYFLALEEKYKASPFSVIFVSVNRPKELAGVDNFWKRQGIPKNSWLLNAKDPNYFIPAIADEWSGAIPATLIIHPAKQYRAFYEQEFTESALHTIIEPLIE